MPGPNIILRGPLDQGFDCLGSGHNGREPERWVGPGVPGRSTDAA
jgi:hypothetical protein